MRATAFMSWFGPLFILYVVLIVGYHVGKAARIEAAERKARQERERIAAERKEKAEARKREQAAARAAKAEEAADQPPRKRGRPRKNPPAEAAAPVPTEPEPDNSAKTGAFAGEVVAFTGTCPKMERRHMISHVARLGGQGYDRINTRCTLLVVGENPGKNQLDQARKWNVPTITWEEWWLRTFNYPAIVKPSPAADEPMTLDQFASTINNAA